ncbi:SgcJ/EcaC family oxidoreductase [Saccharothrix sp.]|uniref:SgcJ/EcaC family oxidoreductase n=1 Tax=Saccharothrix sp. TaxID=1873460 RepID=UPI0028125C1C|nr:SgcJ/EcaC family oxidoreductase [Saccharothrix sp.]
MAVDVGVALSAGDQSAVAAVMNRVVAAWEKHDHVAFSEVFTDNGTMILPGVFKKGRGEISSFMQDAFAGAYRGTRVTGEPIHVRFFAPDWGVVITSGGVLAPGETKPSPERAVHASWVVVKRDGRWLLAAYQNSPAEPRR